MLRDSVGGAGVNLINSELPADIYSDVAVALERILSSRDGLGQMGADWLRAGITRKLTKRPVMTLPYGSTQQSAKEYVLDWIYDNPQAFPGATDKEKYAYAAWLTPLLWEAIGNVVIAARAGMGYLQRRGWEVVSATNEPLKWVSPVGFPVYQNYRKRDILKVDTVLLGGTRVVVNGTEDTEEVNPAKQRSGIAPNFVHSLDSSHMVRTINATHFDAYAMIHDDFGTHPCDTGTLWKVLREEFVNLYMGGDPLQDWADQQPGESKVDMPKKGDLEIMAVLWSEYFFG
jgi:DNA-directed RNA polymerase